MKCSYFQPSKFQFPSTLAHVRDGDAFVFVDKKGPRNEIYIRNGSDTYYYDSKLRSIIYGHQGLFPVTEKILRTYLPIKFLYR